MPVLLVLVGIGALSRCGGDYGPPPTSSPPVRPVQTAAPARAPPPQPPPKAAPAVARKAPQAIEAVVRRLVVTGDRVALRTAPSMSSDVLERLWTGAQIDELSRQAEWVQVQTLGDRRRGWISAAYVRDAGPAPAEKQEVQQRQEPQRQEPLREPLRPSAPVAPAIPVAEIARLIIARSIASYSGNCPCPYNYDRAGRLCGKRSAHSRPGGASPICFEADVTPEMIAGFRPRQ